MANLTHLFHVGQKVRVKNDDFDAVRKWENGTVKEVFQDHIIIHHDELDFDGWYEEGFNIGNVFPDYNFEERK